MDVNHTLSCASISTDQLVLWVTKHNQKITYLSFYLLILACYVLKSIAG